jgi:hypothetical protein
MKGGIPVTFQGLPESNMHFLFDIGRIDAVLAKAMPFDQRTYFTAVIAQQLMQSGAQRRV